MMENKAGRDLQVPQRMTRLSETIACLDKAAEELIVRLAPKAPNRCHLIHAGKMSRKNISSIMRRQSKKQRLG
jgi:hypothetical protein